MASVNLSIILGNLGKDPETSTTSGGKTVCRFSVATTDTWKDKQTGETKSNTEWHNIAVFDRLAENCARYLSKGKQVYIEGKSQTSTYEKDGITRYSTSVIANKVQFIGPKDTAQSSSHEPAYERRSVSWPKGTTQSSQQNNYQQQQQQQGFNQSQNNNSGFDQHGSQGPAFDDDIPF